MKTKHTKGNAPKAHAGAKRGLPAVAKRPHQIPSTLTKGFSAAAGRKFAKLSGV